MHTPEDSVRIVIYDINNPEKFIAVTESDDKGNVKLPGGKFEEQDGGNAYVAAGRELPEELGKSVTAEAVRLTYAGDLPNDDGISKRSIFFGFADLSTIQPTDEIHEKMILTWDTIPEGKNSKHMLSALALTQAMAFEMQPGITPDKADMSQSEDSFND